MSLALAAPPRDPDRLLPMLQQMAEIIAQQNASLASLQARHLTILAERDAVRPARDLVREGRDGAKAEIEKLRLLIRQLQRGRHRPSPFVWRVGSHDDVSRPARCSLALRPVRFAVLPRRCFPRMLQVIRHLLTRPGCFRPERELPGGGRTHLTEAPLDKAHTPTPSSARSGRSRWGARMPCSPAAMAGRATGRSWPAWWRPRS